MDEDYCKGCGKNLPKGIMARLNGDKTFRLNDGVYCETCAKIVVEKRRKELK